MLAYSVILFFTAVMFLGLGAAIYMGNTDLIHDHHRARVKETDRIEYGKSFSRGLFVIAGFLIASGVVGLFGETAPITLTAIGVLFAGIIAGFVSLAKTQKRFNGGIF